MKEIHKSMTSYSKAYIYLPLRKDENNRAELSFRNT